ncbi:hypothetical protein AciM339_1393 [Aciduliprofundum sp. MAR08-339]|nr:hypothetical protein AciM339_1393 [Aciduliprofundum sp. MAR08-339]
MVGLKESIAGAIAGNLAEGFYEKLRSEGFI